MPTPTPNTSRISYLGIVVGAKLLLGGAEKTTQAPNLGRYIAMIQERLHSGGTVAQTVFSQFSII